jgi:hypothetical protein
MCPLEKRRFLPAVRGVDWRGGGSLSAFGGPNGDPEGPFRRSALRTVKRSLLSGVRRSER